MTITKRDKRDRSRLRRCAATAGFALAAAALAPAAPAQAAFDGLEPKCAFGADTLPAPRFDDNFFKSLTGIWASNDGRTGVFFLRGPSATYVVKFESSVDVGVTVSRRLMRQMKLPHDQIVAEFTDAGDIARFADAIGKAAANKALVEPDRAASLQRRARELADSFANNGVKPLKVLVTQFLSAQLSAPNLGVALLQDPALDLSGAQGQAIATRRFAAAVDAISMPHNQRVLGYLYGVDALLGNEDRFFRETPNLANVFLAAGERGAACMAAIDNEARAPAGPYLAINQYLIQRGKGPQPPEGTVEPVAKQMITARTYLDQLMTNYKDDANADHPSIGPQWSLTGDYYLRNKVPAETQIAADTCDDVSIATQASSRTKLPAWIVRRIRATFVQSVTTMGGAIDKWAPQQTPAVVNADAAGRSFGRTRPAFDAVCKSDVRIPYVSDNGGSTNMIRTIDWKIFNKNFSAGVESALMDMGDVAAMKVALKGAFAGLPNYASTDVSQVGLLARSQFIAHFNAGVPPALIVDKMLLDQAKEDYAQPASFQGKIVRAGNFWLPK